MNNYETVFLMKSNLTEEQRKEVLDEIQKYISDNGNITKVDDIGLRKLAYEIRKNNEAYYYIIEFSSDAETIAELERIYRIKDEILKFIVIRKDD